MHKKEREEKKTGEKRPSQSKDSQELRKETRGDTKKENKEY